MGNIHFKRSAISIAALLACQLASAQTASAPEQALPEIVVTTSADASAAGLPGEYAGGQVARGGRVGILGNVDIMDTPFSTTSYTQTFIQDQQAHGVADVLLNDPTVRVARGFGNYQELYVIRGFPTFSDDLAYNGLYGLLPRQFVTTELLERVEVLRGASAFLNGAAPGNAGIGGSVNLLPKRAPNDPLTQFSAGIDSGGQTYLATDLARRFGPDQSTGVRINLARRDGSTAIDDEDRTLNLASVGVDYRGRNFRLSGDLGYQEHKLKQARPNVSLASGIDVPSAPDASANFSQPWSFSNERDTFGTLRGEFDLADNVTAWVAAGGRHGEERNATANPNVINNAGDTETTRFDNARVDNVVTGEAGIRAKLQTGSVGHTVTASFSSLEQRSRNAYGLSAATFASNLYNPVDVAAPAIAIPGGDLGDPLLTQKTRLSSFAVADTLSFADDSVLLTLGARHQKLKENNYGYTTGAQTSKYDKSRVTPVAGLVVKPMKNLSLYANYIEGLSRAPIAGFPASNIGEAFSPIVSRQKEIGVKYDAGKFGMSASAFTITQPNGGLDPATNIFSISGEQRNRGVEMSVFGSPARGVKLLGGLTWLNAEQRKTADGLNEGKDVIGVPDFQANLGSEWDIPGVKGLSVNGRVLYTSSMYADAANTQKVPSWTRLDLGARYITSIGNQTLTIRGALENVTDRDYWASSGGYPGFGYLVLGSPRTLSVTASVDF